jgi:hypothetical protein
MKTIAGIQFTESGILIEKKYNIDNSVFPVPNKELFTGKFLDIAKRVAKYRMAECYRKLHSNLAKAKHISEDMIAWEGGRFNIKVWESLENILTLTDVRDLDLLQCQQLIRSMLLNSRNWLYDHNTETWEEITSGDIQCTDAFKLFITEHIVYLASVQKNPEVEASCR